ncbi:MAG TPA: septum formation initiator family protein [Clostridia bacterium]|nr:septum formation initiator family protein [Clostridia bacterium]
MAGLKPLAPLTGDEEHGLPYPPVITSSRQKGQKKTRARWRSLIVLAVVFYILATLVGLKLELYQADRQLLELQQRKEQLLAEHQQLLQDKEKLNSPAYIERRAREALGLIKPGEKILTPAKPGQVLPLQLKGIDEIGD